MRLPSKTLMNDRHGFSGILLAVGIVMLIAAMVIGGMAAMTSINVGSSYNKQVHGYMENAKWSDDPVAIKDNLTKAVQGMKDLGLNDNDYPVLFDFEKNPGNSMKSQYAQLQIQIERCDTLAAMNKTDYNYQSTLDSIHAYVYNEKDESGQDGWGDEVAQETYGLKFIGNTWLYIIAIILGILGIIALGIGLDY